MWGKWRKPQFRPFYLIIPIAYCWSVAQIGCLIATSTNMKLYEKSVNLYSTALIACVLVLNTTKLMQFLIIWLILNRWKLFSLSLCLSQSVIAPRQASKKRESTVVSLSTVTLLLHPVQMKYGYKWKSLSEIWRQPEFYFKNSFPWKKKSCHLLFLFWGSSLSSFLSNGWSVRLMITTDAMEDRTSEGIRDFNLVTIL